MSEPYEYVIVSEKDPGATGAGSIWSDVSTNPPVLKQRDSANARWVAISPVIGATVTLSSAQILALADTPVQLVPADGVGKIHAIIGVAAVSRFLTSGYTIAGDILVGLGSPNPANALNCFQLALALTGYDSEDEFSYDCPPGSSTGPNGGYGNDVSASENLGIFIAAGTGNPTSGAGACKVTVYYVTFDVS